MKILNTKISLYILYILTLVLCFGTSLWAQQSPVIRDSTSTTFSFNNINVPDISTIVNLYSYDPITNRYYYTSKIGEFDINFPIILTPKEFEELIQKENIKSYYKEKIEAYAGLKNGDEIEAKNLIFSCSLVLLNALKE